MITLHYSTSLDMNAEGLQAIMELAEGDPSMLMETIYDSLQYNPELIQNLLSAIEQADAKPVMMAAHSLKSSSAQIGALEMSKLCGELEMKAKAGRLDDAKHIFQRICHEYENVQKELREWKELLGV